MASDIPDIDPGDGDDGIGIIPGDGVVGAALATGAAIACLSCGSAIVGPFCASCGQKNDDLRRSTFVLFKDFVVDTFSFDSRMWKTLGLMVASPGVVPTNYCHGKRSRYTPPVRLFLVVSFLFFLTLGVTNTMFVAVDVRPKTAEEIAEDKSALETALREADPEARASIETALRRKDAVVVDGQKIACDLSINPRYFVRSQDIIVDEDKWRACADSFSKAAKGEIDSAKERGETNEAIGDVSEEDFKKGFDRVLGGVDQMVSDPIAFNSEINTWLPRVMFFMAPLLALILGIFIRGRDALFFDHLVLSLYSHATGFAIIGVAVILAQLGAPNMLPIAMAALGAYFIAALRRAYKRGWIKTVYSAAFSGALYLILLAAIVGVIISNQIWRASA